MKTEQRIPGKMTDDEIYEKVKSLFIKEYHNIKIDDSVFSAYFEECTKRGTDIYFRASDDAFNCVFKRKMSLINHEDKPIPELNNLSGYSTEPVNDYRFSIVTKPGKQGIYDIIGLKEDDIFVCRAFGISMVDEDISEGDILIADRTEKESEGKIVIVDIEGKLFVKRLFTESGTIVLKSANPAFPPFILDKNVNYEIIGVVKLKLRNTGALQDGSEH